MKIKRKIEVVVISDLHLGTEECQAKHLLTYLNSITPKTLILNGDIINVLEFNKGHFPKAHLKVIKTIMDMASEGVEVIYVIGNHDDALRKYSGRIIGNISIVNKKIIHLDGKKAWIFHGDVFDISLQKAKWLVKLGSYGYKMLRILNKITNWYLDKRGKERISLSKKLKIGIKSAVKHANNFEKTISELAIKNGYDYVICGHIHQPCMKYIQTNHGSTTYLNSGDWVEHFTALEYQFKRWRVYNFNKDKLSPFIVDKDEESYRFRDLIAAITIVEQNQTLKKDND